MACSMFARGSFQCWFRVLFILALSGLFAGPAVASPVPTVTATAPAVGATEVPADSAITATFSEPMEPATITPGSITLSQPVRIKAIAAGYNYSLALKDNSTVTGWGYNGNGQTTVPTGLSGVTAIAAGVNHSVALQNDGTIVAWGDNTLGQSTLPAGLAEVIAIAAAGDFSLALNADKTVVAWGDNSHGQTIIPGGLAGVISIATGNAHALALKADGTVVAWGYNNFGQTTVPPSLSGVSAVAAGVNHSLALKADGTVVAWGANNKGQSSVPAGLSGVIAITAKMYYSVALKADGTVVAWGDNTYGQTDIPAGLAGIAAIAAGYYHTVALKNDGTVISWGDNSNSQTTLPAGLAGVTAVATGSSHTVALKSDGSLFAWGYNSNGQATIPAGLYGVSAIAAGLAHTISLSSSGSVNAWGRNNYGQTTVPTDLAGVTAIAAGDNHSAAIKNDGTVVAWGLNSSGQATVPAGLTAVTNIAAGTAHTLALKQDGTVTAWGSNVYNASSTPAGLSGVIAVAAGGYHSVALKNDGTLSAWGENTRGQSTVPPGLTGVIAIAAGYYHSVALKSDGTVVAWGANDFGESTVPAGLSGVVGIAAGNSYTVAVKNDGTLVGWGDNKIGQATTPQDPYVQPVAIAVSYSTASNSVTLNPDSLLPLATTLTATVNRGVRSLEGTHPAVDYSWRFTTTTTTTPPVTAASPPGGRYAVLQNVTLTANGPATVYYTTNGTTPTIASPAYSGPIPISVTTALKFFARDAAGNSETPQTATYTIVADPTPPVTTASPAGGTYSSLQNVTLTANEPAIIYYTTNGSVPTISSTVYSGSIAIPATTNLKFFAQDTAGNIEMFRTENYTIKQNQAITFAPVPVKVYGNPSFTLNATASSGLPVSYASNNTSVATVSGSTVTIVGAGSVTITASQGGDAAWDPAPALTQLLTVDKVPLIVQAANANRVYGAENPALSATYSGFTNGDTQAVLSGSSGLSTAATATSPVGTYPITVTDGTLAAANYSFSLVNGTLSVTKAEQTITFDALPAKTYGDPSFTLSATAGSGLAVTYTSSNTTVAVVSGNTVIIAGAGSATITASQDGDGNYNAAPAVAQTLTVNKAPATIIFGLLTFTYDGNPKPVTVTTIPAGLAVAITYGGSATAPTNVGSYNVVAAVNDANYQGSATATEEIVKRNQTITFGPLTAKIYGETPFDLAAEASSNLAVTYTSSNTAVATISKKGNNYSVAIVGAGTTIITAYQDGNGNYNNAPPVSQTLTVNKAAGTVTLGSLSATYDGSAKAATATTTPAGLAVTFTYSGSATTPTAAGNYSVIGTINDANHQGSSSGTLAIARASQAITFAALPAKNCGNAPFNPNATASSGLAVSYTSSNPAVATINGTTVTIVGVGTTTITASQGGDGNYSAADAVAQTLTVDKGAQAITFGALPLKTVLDTPFTPAATSTSGLPVSYTSSNPAVATVSGTTVTIVGVGTTTITASQGGDANYNAASAMQQTLTVGKGTATVTLGNLNTSYSGTAQAATATTVPSGLPVTLTYNDSATAPTAVGSYSVMATVNSPNYQGSATGTLTIAKGAQTITFGSLPLKTVGNAPFTLIATSSSDLAVSYSSSNLAVATINGATVTIVGAGTSTITASQGGDANYNAASPVAQALTINASLPASGKTAVTIGGTTSYYDTVTAALAAIPAGVTTTIKLQVMTFTEALNINVSGATISITGGYDSGFTSTAGMSTIQGNLVISTGALIADKLVIR
jgi:alpha-tubulin suppressor-like RCC1 family protein